MTNLTPNNAYKIKEYAYRCVKRSSKCSNKCMCFLPPLYHCLFTKPPHVLIIIEEDLYGYNTKQLKKKTSTAMHITMTWEM